MKRARYLAGAIGMAPAAAALAMGPAAHAAIAPSHGIRHGKTVSQALLPGHRATLAAATSVSSSGLESPGLTTGGCTGKTYKRVPRNGNVRGHLWYANSLLDASTCIGTFVTSVFFNKTFCKHVSISVFSSAAPGLYDDTYNAKICGTAGQWTEHAFGLHTWYGHFPLDPLKVVVKSTYGARTSTFFGS